MSNLEFRRWCIANVGGATRFERALRRAGWRLCFALEDHAVTLLVAAVPIGIGLGLLLVWLR